MSRPNPEYRLTNLRRAVRDLHLGHRLSIDPEATGVVELSDFSTRCEKVAELGQRTVIEFAALQGEEARCVVRVAEDVELACRLAAALGRLPRNAARVHLQSDILEEAVQLVERAQAAEALLEEPAVHMSMNALAEAEVKLFRELVEVEGERAPAPPALIQRDRVRRKLRRALLEAEGETLRVDVTPEGVLRFGDWEFVGEAGAPTAEELPRAANEPESVRKALEMRERSDDGSLRDFLLTKAAAELLRHAMLPRLGSYHLRLAARELPHKPGKKFAVRPEVVHLAIPGWDAPSATKAVERVAAGRAGPDWAALPRGAYLFRLLVHPDDGLAGDLLSLHHDLRRMERGETPEGAGTRAERVYRALLPWLE